MRALGCGVEALVAQLGAKNAIKRVETELRRARRARSRKLHAFWSGVLVRIETETDEQRNPKPPRGARRIASLGNDAGRRVKGAPGDGVGAEALETPAPWGVSRRLVPRRRRTRLLDRGVSGGLGSNVFRVILLGRHRRRHGPQHGKQPARARRSPRTHADMQSPRPGQGSRVRHRRLRTKRPGRWRRKPETFCISVETAGPDCAARASPTD